MNPKQTICWECKHADKGKDSICPWDREFKPVEGWDATRRDILVQGTNQNQPAHYDESYRVNKCPLFERG